MSSFALRFDAWELLPPFGEWGHRWLALGLWSGRMLAGRKLQPHVDTSLVLQLALKRKMLEYPFGWLGGLLAWIYLKSRCCWSARQATFCRHCSSHSRIRVSAVEPPGAGRMVDYEYFEMGYVHVVKAKECCRTGLISSRFVSTKPFVPVLAIISRRMAQRCPPVAVMRVQPAV